jgi:predicted ATP-binding protein involved in virulence
MTALDWVHSAQRDVTKADMQIDRIILRDVGPFQDVMIELPRGQDPQLADVYLLTGPNGSGKSTVLYALSALIAGGQDGLGQDFLTRRFRSENAMTGFAARDTRRVGIPSGRMSTIPDPLGGSELTRFFANGQLSIYKDGRSDDYASLAGTFGSASLKKFSWAAFAYAGKRTLEQGLVKGVQETLEGPFNQSLSFIDTARTAELAKWIINQQFRQFKAQNAGRTARAEQLGKSTRDTERLIGQIIGDDEFRFITTDEDNDVRVRWHGKDVDLDLLPDGLKSITSWIADLLMRLDRIPWVDDLPILQRSFLLLLDEVDIHLHPTWQRQVLPFVQRMFPNAQIIATTHSPFVVASAADAHIVTFALKDGVSTLEHVAPSQIGVSYSAVLRSIFGIDSEFDVETEGGFRKLHDAKARLLSGDRDAENEVDRIATDLTKRSEEVKELVALELAQLKRQRARLPQ